MSIFFLAKLFKILGLSTVGVSILYAIIAYAMGKRIRIGCLILIVAMVCFWLSAHFERQYLYYGGW